MAIVRLYGHLQRFGRKFELHVNHSSEAIKALTSQIAGFKSAVLSGEFRVRINRQDHNEQSLKDTALHKLDKSSIIHIVPVVGGAKDTGMWSVIGGAVLIGIGICMQNPSLVWAGIGMAAGGAVAMLTPTPEVGSSADDNGDANEYMATRKNVTAQGSCVDLIYGEVMHTPKLLGQGLEVV